jgi:hypothetical protein
VKILFLHGWHSTPGGVKPTYLKEHGHEVLNPALPDDDFEAAVRIAQAEFDRHRPHVVVGSSRGGAVAMNLDAGTTPLVLLCPAWNRWGMAKKVFGRAVILHSRADEVIPFSDSQVLWRNSHLPLDALIEVGTEHRLADPQSLKMMLWAVKKFAPPAPRPVVPPASVPRQFGVGTMLLITTVYALLFALLSALHAHPAAFAVIGLCTFAIGLGQMLLFKGKRPRLASVIVGASLGIGFLIVVSIIDELHIHGRIFHWELLAIAAIYGGVSGYVVGSLIASIFLFADKFDRLIHGRRSAVESEDATTASGGNQPITDVSNKPAEPS